MTAPATPAPARHLRTAPAVLSCRGLRHGFDGHVVVDDVSFDVRAGEVYGLVGLLARAGADLVGLWHGVGGRHELATGGVAELAAVARSAGIEPVLVTFRSDVDALAAVLVATGVRWVQLHGYQPPGVVRGLRAAVPDAVLVKVLHLTGATCPERRFVPAYERAGTDLFLLDAATADGRVGSTGFRLPGPAVLDLVESLDRPFLLAGGVTAEGRSEQADIMGHPRCAGVDVDTGARDAAGEFCPERVARLVAAYTPGTR